MSIRLIGLRVDKLVEREQIQLSLFDNKNNEKQERLDEVIDSIKQKYGYNSITRAGKINLPKGTINLKKLE